MASPSQQSGRSSMFVALLVLIGGVAAFVYFDLEEKLLGYPYLSYWWRHISHTVMSIPAAIEAMLRSVSNL